MNPYIKSLGSTDIMSNSEEKTLSVSPDQGTTGEPATPKREGAEAKMKQTTQDQTSHQASAIAEKPWPPWWLFVEDPIKDYEKDMALIGHEPAPAPPLPQSGIDHFTDKRALCKTRTRLYL